MVNPIDSQTQLVAKHFSPIFLCCSFHLLFKKWLFKFTLIELTTMFIFVQVILQATPKIKHFGIQRKPLPLEPSVLLREANRRRASLSAGNVFEMFDGRPTLIDG